MQDIDNTPLAQCIARYLQFANIHPFSYSTKTFFLNILPLTAYEILVVLRRYHTECMIRVSLGKCIRQPRLLCRVPFKFICM